MKNFLIVACLLVEMGRWALAPILGRDQTILFSKPSRPVGNALKNERLTNSSALLETRMQQVQALAQDS